MLAHRMKCTSKNDDNVQVCNDESCFLWCERCDGGDFPPSDILTTTTEKVRFDVDMCAGMHRGKQLHWGFFDTSVGKPNLLISCIPQLFFSFSSGRSDFKISRWRHSYHFSSCIMETFTRTVLAFLCFLVRPRWFWKAWSRLFRYLASWLSKTI